MASSTHNPWVAFGVTTDPVAHASALRRAHERGLAPAGASPRDVRGLVFESWKRSLAAGVAPDAVGAPVRLAGDALEGARERSPLAPASAEHLLRVHRELGAEFTCQLELLVDQIDVDYPSASDRCVLDRQVPQPTDAEYRDQI